MKFNWRTKLSRKNRFLAMVALAGLAMTGTLMATAPEHDSSMVDEKVWPVTTMALQAQELSPELRLFGRVETPRHAHLTAGVTATVETLAVSEGQLVEEGTTLLILDDADEELRYQQREADTAQAQAALETTRLQFAVDRQVLKHMQELHNLTLAKSRRLGKLAQQNLVATEQYEDTRAQVARQAIQLAEQQLKVDNQPQQLAMAEVALKRAQALLEEQDLRLARTLVTAPFRGRISSISASPGDRVSEGAVLISVYDTAALQVRVTIPSSAVEPIKQALEHGDAVVARYGERGAQSLQLKQLAAQIANGRAGVDGLFQVSGNGDMLELGKALDVTLVLPALEQVASIPLRSLYGDDRIYTVIDGRLQGVEVQALGQRRDTNGQVQLLIRSDSTSPGAEILTTSLPQASTGLRVNVING